MSVVILLSENAINLTLGSVGVGLCIVGEHGITLIEGIRLIARVFTHQLHGGECNSVTVLRTLYPCFGNVIAEALEIHVVAVNSYVNGLSSRIAFTILIEHGVLLGLNALGQYNCLRSCLDGVVEAQLNGLALSGRDTSDGQRVLTSLSCLIEADGQRVALCSDSTVHRGLGGCVGQRGGSILSNSDVIVVEDDGEVTQTLHHTLGGSDGVVGQDNL